MGFFDALFGKQKPVPMGPERLFAMSTADITLETDQHLTPTGNAALCFRGVASGPFQDIQKELEQILQITARDDQMTVKPFEDSYGYQWFIFTATNFQTLVTVLHVASQTLAEKGYDSRLAFAVFAFKDQRAHELYFMYNYKRGYFYPLVPVTTTKDDASGRDNPEERRLAVALAHDLPMEPDEARWFAMWNLPL